MTYLEAINQGYKNGDTTFFRGYVSRKINVAAQPVKIAEGNRKGQLYVELPYYSSSQYSLRQYLVKV